MNRVPDDDGDRAAAKELVPWTQHRPGATDGHRQDRAVGLCSCDERPEVERAQTGRSGQTPLGEEHQRGGLGQMAETLSVRDALACVVTLDEFGTDPPQQKSGGHAGGPSPPRRRRESPEGQPRGQNEGVEPTGMVRCDHKGRVGRSGDCTLNVQVGSREPDKAADGGPDHTATRGTSRHDCHKHERWQPYDDEQEPDIHGIGESGQCSTTPPESGRHTAPTETDQLPPC